ncbi:MAG: reductive dehalogenase domain-containing protein, partial [Pseudomonadota bacterium]
MPAWQAPARVSKADSTLAAAAQFYTKLFAQCATSTPAPRAPVPEDLQRRSQELKGAAYYLDAAHAGICQIPSHAWLAQDRASAADEKFALILWVRHGLPVEDDNLASQWLNGAQDAIAAMRALEIGAAITGHIRAMGYNASLHDSEDTRVNLHLLALLAGIGVNRDAQIVSPFFGADYAPVAVTTDYPLAVDTPLANQPATLQLRRSLRYWWGINGAVSGREHNRQRRRASHLSRYPMEQVKRVAEPTTLIFADEVPRVPKRAEFFQRARSGDLGPKAQQEVKRFAFKHPLTDGMMYPLRAMVAHQDGNVAEAQEDQFGDAAANARAIKSLSYHLGADLTGICEIPPYAWYSHDARGQAIVPRHKYAVVMLIDQGYDTMEGASGDDWISGCQSMRGYIRGAEIAGVMAEFLRKNGFEARPQTNADSQVLQIPLVLLAGLGELSRIGELVLNPYVGPRFKSVVLTTNLPLAVDQPIDFGLQQFCKRCFKCARECPVNAIPFGDKVMFNGYEIWKPDVERCTRYRVTNPKGSACGRCMKTCPLNKVVSADGAWLHRIGTWLGVNAGWLKPVLVPLAVWLDDRLGYGKRNPLKRWWLDLELRNGKAQIPRGTNERDLDIHRDISGKKSPVGYYHASDMPAPDSHQAVPVDHKQAIKRGSLLESVAQARARRARRGAKPA